MYNLNDKVFDRSTSKVTFIQEVDNKEIDPILCGNGLSYQGDGKSFNDDSFKTIVLLKNMTDEDKKSVNKSTQDEMANTTILFDSCGEHCKHVNQKYMEKKGLTFTQSPFSPLTEREHMLMMYGDGIAMHNNVFGRFVRMYEISGKKYIGFSDDDYVDVESRKANMLERYKRTFDLFSNIAIATGGRLLDDTLVSSLPAYDVEVVIPLSFFDFINTKEQYKYFMINCNFENIEKSIEDSRLI